MLYKKKARENPQNTDKKEEDEIVALPWFTMPTLNYFCFAGVVLLALNSSNNAYTPRAIFEAPFLTEKECSHVIKLFNSIELGSRNDVILHENHSEVISSYLENHLNGRLGPLLERVSSKAVE